MRSLYNLFLLFSNRRDFCLWDLRHSDSFRYSRATIKSDWRESHRQGSRQFRKRVHWKFSQIRFCNCRWWRVSLVHIRISYRFSSIEKYNFQYPWSGSLLACKSNDALPSARRPSRPDRRLLRLWTTGNGVSRWFLKQDSKMVVDVIFELCWIFIRHDNYMLLPILVVVKCWLKNF